MIKPNIIFRFIIGSAKLHLHKFKMKRKWRHGNRHNTTFLELIPNSDDFFNKVTVGEKTYGPICAFYSENPIEQLTIGNYCSIGSGVIFLLGSEHPYKGLSTFPFKVKCAGYSNEATSKGPICLKDDVWIGENAIILSGVTIEQGAIVAAGSVVVKSVPPYAIVGGNPAKIIKNRFSDDVIQKLQTIDWSKVNQAKIISSLDLLYEEIDSSNVDDILKRFNDLIL